MEVVIVDKARKLYRLDESEFILAWNCKNLSCKVALNGLPTTDLENWFGLFESTEFSSMYPMTRSELERLLLVTKHTETEFIRFTWDDTLVNILCDYGVYNTEIESELLGKYGHKEMKNVIREKLTTVNLMLKLVGKFYPLTFLEVRNKFAIMVPETGALAISIKGV